MLNHKDQYTLALDAVRSSYTPKYAITDNAKNSIANIDRDKWAFERLIIDPKYEGWLRRRAFIRSGHHSLHIEGSRLSEGEVADILDDPTSASSDDPEQKDVKNWYRAMSFIDSMASNRSIPINSLLIRHIHQLMLGADDPVNRPGDYRRGEARVRHPVTRKPVFRGPPAGDVPDLMDQLGGWITNGAKDIHPVIAAGIAHLRLVEIHPFIDGNGRTTRALSTLMLSRSEYSFNQLLALERYFDFDLLKYCEAIGETVGEQFEEGRDLTQWLEYFPFALSVEVSLASDAVLDLRRALESWHAKLSTKVHSERHRDILAYAIINHGVRPRDVMRFAGVSAVTVSDDLKRLSNLDLLEPQGKGRARIYMPSEDFWRNLDHSGLSTSPDEKEGVSSK